MILPDINEKNEIHSARRKELITETNEIAKKVDKLRDSSKYQVNKLSNLEKELLVTIPFVVTITHLNLANKKKGRER